MQWFFIEKNFCRSVGTWITIVIAFQICFQDDNLFSDFRLYFHPEIVFIVPFFGTVIYICLASFQAVVLLQNFESDTLTLWLIAPALMYKMEEKRESEM